VTPEPAGPLEVERIGEGPPVVFVHGSVVGAGLTFRKQLKLAERWTLILPNRPGFGGSPPLERGDFEAAERLGAERAVIPGRGHTIPSTGEPYNRRLERLAASDRLNH
jgi:pimeloyl-ACP methyl ester carboxylesterase